MRSATASRPRFAFAATPRTTRTGEGGGFGRAAVVARRGARALRVVGVGVVVGIVAAWVYATWSFHVAALRGNAPRHPLAPPPESGSVEPPPTTPPPPPDDDTLAAHPHENTTFASLRLCRKEHPKLSCGPENEECSPAKPCVHHQIKRGENTRTWAKTVDLTKGYKMQVAFHQSRAERLTALKSVLSHMEQEMGPPLTDPHSRARTYLVVGFNRGYAYLFGNWVESLRSNSVDLASLQRSLLILATDEGARSFAKQLGFFVFDPTPFLSWTLKPIAEYAPGKFGDGGHGQINVVVKFSMVHDLLHLGHNAAVMDTDIIWTQNALPLMVDHCLSSACHGAFISDMRQFDFAASLPLDLRDGSQRAFYRLPTSRDEMGSLYPYYNTGFFFLRACERTRNFARLLMDSVHVQQWKATDQLIYNTLMYHSALRDMRWVLLPTKRFVGGGSLHRNKPWTITFPVLPPSQLVMVHASDVGTHLEKVEKFVEIGHWYLGNDTAAFRACEGIAGCFHRKYFDVLGAAAARRHRTSTTSSP